MLIYLFRLFTKYRYDIINKINKNRIETMKKVLATVLIFSLVFLSLPLSSQYRYTFPEYMENLQKKVPLKAIEWFNENAYAPTYGVSELIFAFYRGVSRYTSYTQYKGSPEDLDKAAGDFRQALDIPYDARYLYTDRSLLYIAGILTISEGDKELAARIFKYYIDNCGQYDPNYPTAIYWSLYLKYLNPITYQLYYDTLVRLDNMGVYSGPIIYDYFDGKTKTIPDMLRRLENPANATLYKYGRISENADVFEAIKNIVPIIPEDKNLSTWGATYQYLIFEEYPPKENVNYGTISPSLGGGRKSNDRNIDAIMTNNASINTRVETNRNTTNTNFYIPPTSSISSIPDISSSGLYNLTISVDKVANNNVRIDIAGRTFNTRNSTNFNVQLSQGEYDVLVSFLGRQYTNIVNVSSSSYNLLSIVIQDENIR